MASFVDISLSNGAFIRLPSTQSVLFSTTGALYGLQCDTEIDSVQIDAHGRHDDDDSNTPEWKMLHMTIMVIIIDREIKQHVLGIYATAENTQNDTHDDTEPLKALITMPISQNMQYQIAEEYFHTMQMSEKALGLGFNGIEEARDFAQRIAKAMPKNEGDPNAAAADVVSPTPKKRSFISKLKGFRFLSDKKPMQISSPTGFQHKTHIGFDTKGGFEISSIPSEWIDIFSQSGIRKVDLKDPDVAQTVLQTLAQSEVAREQNYEPVLPSKIDLTISNAKPPPALPPRPNKPPLLTKSNLTIANESVAPSSVEITASNDENSQSMRPPVPPPPPVIHSTVQPPVVPAFPLSKRSSTDPSSGAVAPAPKPQSPSSTKDTISVDTSTVPAAPNINVSSAAVSSSSLSAGDKSGLPVPVPPSASVSLPTTPTPKVVDHLAEIRKGVSLRSTGGTSLPSLNTATAKQRSNVVESLASNPLLRKQIEERRKKIANEDDDDW